MKKTLLISILVAIILMACATVVNATTSSTLADELYTKGEKYGMTTADKVKIERYLADNPVTEAEANAIVAKANAAAKIMDEAGTKDYKSLPADKKAELKSLANEAAGIVGATLSFKANSVEIYKDGKLIETIGNNGGKLAYTGNNNIVLVVSSIAVIALASVAVARKKLANA